MHKNSLSFASYWRNSLADAELGKGAWAVREKQEVVARPLSELQAGLIDIDAVDNLFNSAGLAATDVWLDVVFHPFVFRARAEHARHKSRAQPYLVAPVVVTGRLRRDGRLFAQARVAIARDILEPVDRHSFVVGSIDDLDTFLTDNTLRDAPDVVETPSIERDGIALAYLQDVIAYGEGMLAAVAGHWLTAATGESGQPDDSPRERDGGYVLTDEWLLRRVDLSNGPSRRIIDLYDHLRQNNPEVPLFDAIAQRHVTPTVPCLSRGEMFAAHVGYPNDRFPLVPTQRDALAHTLAAQSGEVLAVNGPPGTGKTTLLLSVVASRWVEAAIVGEAPPVIVVASTNNQAVTNVIDAFGKDFSAGEGVFAGRWLPKLDSFGSYFVSNLKKGDANQKYQTQDFFDSVETIEYLIEARSAFFAAARKAYPDLVTTSVAPIVERLRADLLALQQKLIAIAQARKPLDGILSAVEKLCRGDVENGLAEDLAKAAEAADAAAADMRTWSDAYSRWTMQVSQEPRWLALLDALPPVRAMRLARATAAARALLKTGVRTGKWQSIQEIEQTLSQAVQTKKRTLDAKRRRVEAVRALIDEVDVAKRGWTEALREAGCGDADAGIPSLDEAERLTDTGLRFRLFQLATHYWEGRWLMEMEAAGKGLNDLRRKKGRVQQEARWRRRMMLTPCAVSTFYMLPGEFQFVRHDDGFIPDYLYNFIDLLIVDEAGQVLPEVAGAAFSLAKQSLVIGDTLQIEPIWAVPRHVDLGNLIHHGLLPKEIIDGDEKASEQAFSQLSQLGKTASSGNLMAIAQTVSRYHYDVDLPRGLALVEHRRCHDEIIAFCNALCYHNKLVPKRGPKPHQVHEDGFHLPAMGYRQVKGACRLLPSGSRANDREALIVAMWLADHRGRLEKLYGRPLHQIVGIITPFIGQVEAIRAACQRYRLPVSGEHALTIGTVHALQGAERSLVIFSPVYAGEEDGDFIDRSPSMLNVAVSRAKDSFLVFGDIDLFDPRYPGTPRGLLATYLLKNPDAALTGREIL